MIKILSYRHFESQSLKGFVNILVEKWRLEIHNIKIFESNGKKWMSFPAEKSETKKEDGKHRFFPHLRFTDPADAAHFSTAFFAALDEWKKQNPQNQPEIKETFDNELPF